MTVFKLLLKIVVAPVMVLLTLFVWTCVALVYVSGLVLGLASMVIALLGVAVLVTYSPQNGEKRAVCQSPYRTGARPAGQHRKDGRWHQCAGPPCGAP